MVKKEGKFIIITLVLIAMLIIPITVYSSDVITNPGGYRPSDQLTGTSASKIESITSKILTVLSNIGIVVSVVSISIVGVKYMAGSLEEKAKYKESMFPYVVGIILVFGISSVVKALQAIGEKINI